MAVFQGHYRRLSWESYKHVNTKSWQSVRWIWVSSGMLGHVGLIITSSFYSRWSTGYPWRASKRCNLQLSPWPHSMIFLYFLFRPLLSFATFFSAYLFFCIPEDCNPKQFSLLLLLLYVMCVLSSSIFFFLSEFLLVSVWWFCVWNKESKISNYKKLYTVLFC